MKNEIVFCTVASNDYLPSLERLLASAQLFIPNQIIHIVLVNVDSLKAKYLESLYNNVCIEFDYYEFENNDELRGWCTNRRALLFPKIMEKYSFPVVWIDADTLFINEAGSLIQYAKKYDLSVDYSNTHPTLGATEKQLKNYSTGPLGTPYFGVFNNSVIVTNNSNIAKKLFNYFSELIQHHRLIWFADQEGLYLTYKKFKNRIKFMPLEKKFCSRSYHSSKIIWTGKANIKDKKEYIKLGDRYILNVRKWPIKKLDINKSIDCINPSNPINIRKKSFSKRLAKRIYKSFKFLITGKINEKQLEA
tara:strand:+ start:827 stop:1741 length:915 start_codon:yes stop_codon:yes gene_type:complete